MRFPHSALTRVGLSAVSGAALFLSLPKPGLSVLVWVAVVPLLVVVVTETNPRRAFLWGYLGGVVFFAGSCYWFASVVGKLWGTFPPECPGGAAAFRAGPRDLFWNLRICTGVAREAFAGFGPRLRSCYLGSPGIRSYLHHFRFPMESGRVCGDPLGASPVGDPDGRLRAVFSGRRYGSLGGRFRAAEAFSQREMDGDWMALCSLRRQPSPASASF